MHPSYIFFADSVTRRVPPATSQIAVGLPRGRTRERAFTLIEIMVVVIIIGILAAIVAPNVIGRVDDAQITKAKAEISNIENAM